MPSSDLPGSILESAPDAIIISDRAGEILFANTRVRELLGYAPAELIGQRVELLLPERLRPRHVEHRDSYARDPQVRPMGSNLELCARRKDGTEVPVEISLSPVQDGARMLTATALRDVTERKRIQAELLRARESADRANQAKSRFLATASHDLRQPLQTLALLNGLLRRIIQDPVAGEAIAQQDQAIDTMSRLLNALLDISKLESGAVRPDLRHFGLEGLFGELQAEFTKLAASKGLSLCIDAGGCTVWSDSALVGQILRNLLSNAIKYTRAGSVRLQARAADGRIGIEVADTGIGIPAEQIRFIYDEFFQVEAPDGAGREGYGLGLSIVRRLVTLLELKLEVQSQVGRGTMCLLTLPAGEAGEVAVAPRAEPAGSRALSPRVILVDDDPGVRNATAMLLRVDGWQVATASSLAEAARAAREDPRVDLLITDYHLGHEDTGTQVIAAVREVLGRTCKAVLITGDTSSTVRDLRPDADTWLASKPIHADEFLSLIRDLVASPEG